MDDGEQMSFVKQLPRAETIARLNDKLRMSGEGGAIVVTRGVRALAGYDTAALLAALVAYDGFDADNDPHGERDFGDVELCGQSLLWKIDYYDQELRFASPDAADASAAARVLTVMLESEY
jgi:hypothetical protein